MLGVLSSVGLRRPRAGRSPRRGEMLARVVPRERSAGHRGAAAGLLDDVDAADAGRTRVDVRLRASLARRSAARRGSRPTTSSARWREHRRRQRSTWRSSSSSTGSAVHRPPEPTFFAVAYAWVAGESFAEVVADEELTGGDFVRTMKQLIDLLGQIATVAPDPDDTRDGPAGRRRLLPRRRRRRVAPSAKRDPSVSGIVTIGKGAEWGEPRRPARRTSWSPAATPSWRRSSRRCRAGAATRWRAGDLRAHARGQPERDRRCNSRDRRPAVSRRRSRDVLPSLTSSPVARLVARAPSSA